MLPVRYKIKEEEKERFLICSEEPNIRVKVERGFCVSSSSAKKYPPGSVFLDGAAQGEPFLDTQRKIYNLDHHEGCIRAFTLATCEQAMVMLLKRLDLETGEWCLYANEPDMDTVLSIWVFLNHRRINNEENPEIRRKIMPIVRMQGLIDSHGLGMEDLSGFPQNLQEEVLNNIAHFRKLEVDLKKNGRWNETDILAYTLSALSAIDEHVYSSLHFADALSVEEVSRVSIGRDRIAVVCRSEQGIYEAEQQLRKIHGNRLGVIILQKDENNYTLRQVDTFLPINLAAFYTRLNTLDPAVRGDLRWGGSGDIGGSPRGIGTRLSCKEISSICQWVFDPEPGVLRFQALAKVVALGLLLVPLVQTVCFFLFPEKQWRGFLISNGPRANLSFAAILLVLTAVLLFPRIRRQPRPFALNRPKGWGWTAFLAPLLIVGMGGAIWSPIPLSQVFQMEPPPYWQLLFPLATALSCEFFFRGLIQGMLVEHYRIMRHSGPWFFSVPTVVTAVLSAIATLLLYETPEWLFPYLGIYLSISLWAVAALAFGLLTGFARERWGSLAVPVALHLSAVALIGGFWMVYPLS